MANKTGARTITVAERRAEALELRKQGLTYEVIGQKLGISNTAAYKHVRRALDAIEKDIDEKATHLKIIEKARLERLFNSIWNAATGGDLYAIDRALKIMERQAKLLGLDAPVKTAQTNPEGTESAYDKMSDEELMARLEELREKT